MKSRTFILVLSLMLHDSILAQDKLVKVMELHESGPVSSVCFSPDSLQLALVSFQGTASVYDTASWKAKATLKWDIRSDKGNPNAEFNAEKQREIQLIKYWTKTSWLIERNGLEIWDSARKKIEPLQLNSRILNILSHGPEPTFVITGQFQSEQGPFILWDLKTRKRLCTLTDFRSGFGDLDISRDGRRLVKYGMNDHLIRVWDGATGKIYCQFNPRQPKSDAVISLAISADGKLLAYAQRESIYLYHLEKQQDIGSIPSNGTFYALGDCMKWLPDHARLLVMSRRSPNNFIDYLLAVYEIPSGRMLASATWSHASTDLMTKSTPIDEGLTISPNGRWAVTYRKNKPLKSDLLSSANVWELPK